MSDIFNDLLDGNLDGELITEAFHPEDVPYLKTVRRLVYLPEGKPIGRGNTCFLYTQNFEESLNLIKNPSNFLPKNNYKIYYYEMQYIGVLLGKRYKFRDYDIRKYIYSRISKETKAIPIVKLAQNAKNRNMYYDLHRWIDIFEHICYNYQQARYLKTYWTYLTNIVNTVDITSNKFILCDISKYSCGKTWKDNIRNPLYLLYYAVYKLASSKSSGLEFLKKFDVDFLFFAGKKVLKINFSQLDPSSDIKALRVEMLRLLNGIAKEEDIKAAIDDEELDKEEIVSKAANKVSAKLVSDFEPDKVVTNVDTGSEFKVRKLDPRETIQVDDDDDLGANKVTSTQRHISAKKIDNVNKVEDIQKQINDLAREEYDKKKDVIDPKDPKGASSDEIAAQVRQQMEEDRKLIEQIYNKMKSETPKKTAASSARDKLLKEQQKEININGLKLKDLEKLNITDIKIPVHDVSKVVSTSNDNMKELRFANFDKTYNEKVMPKHIMSAFTAFDDKSIPMFIRDIKVEDTSDELNYKDTYTVFYEDGNRKRHTVKVDIPKFIDDKFLYIGGNKKIMKHQNIYLPIVKLSPTTAQIVSNYSKMTLERVENKSISAIERLKKTVNKNDDFLKYFNTGNVYSTNGDYVTTIEYDDLSKVYQSFKVAKTEFFFSQPEAEKYREKHGYPVKKNKMFIGIYKGSPCYIDYDEQEAENGKTITEMIVDSVPEDLSEEYAGVKSPKSLMYVKVKLMAQFVNVGMLLGLWEGISSLLNRMKVEYRLENKIPKDLRPYEDFIKFKDCILVYRQNVSNALILNGIKSFNTMNYDLEAFDSKEPYIDYVRKVYGRSIIENALMNFYEFFIDDITKAILIREDLPTNIVDVMIYATKLLSDSQSIPNISQTLQRVRLGEIIPAILYEKLTKAYVPYRNSNGRKKYSVQQDCVIKEILSLKTTEDYSTLNPSLELQQTHAISTKGFNGVNLDDSYTVPRRAYDPSMTGVIAPGTSPDASVGIAKFLSMEPKITDLMGICEDNHDNLKALKDVNIFSPAELSLPGATTVDEPNRLGFVKAWLSINYLNCWNSL